MKNKNIIIFIIAIILSLGIIIGFYFWKKTIKEKPITPTPITPETQQSTPTTTTEFDENSSSETLIEDTVSKIEKDVSEMNPEEDFKSFENSDVGL